MKKKLLASSISILVVPTLHDIFVLFPPKHSDAIMAYQGQGHTTLEDTCPSFKCVSDPRSGLPLTSWGLHEGLLERHGHYCGVLRPHLILSHRGVSC